MLKEISLSKIDPNPFRRLDEYPIIRTKIDALKESFAATTFWGNIVARPNGDRFEIAYGHHRLIALKELYGKSKKVEILVRKLSNEQMIQIMARENMEEWGTSAWVEIETIRTVIDAYGKDEISMPKVPVKTNDDQIRDAGQGIVPHPYTTFTVAEFLGWTRKKGDSFRPNYACETAFRALDMIDKGFIKESDLFGIGRKGTAELINSQWAIFNANMRVAKTNEKNARQVDEQAEQAKDVTEKRRLVRKAEIYREQAAAAEQRATEDAKRFAKEGSNMLRNGSGFREMKAKAQERKPSTREQARALNVDEAIEKISDLLGRIANGDDQLSESMEVISKNASDASASSLRSLDKAFVAVINRLEKMRQKLLSRV